MNKSYYNGMTADQYIDEAIKKGITYRREYLKGGYTRITFTDVETGLSANSTDKNQNDAAELAFIMITNKTK